MPSTNKYHLPKIYLRFLPTLFALSILAAFFLYQPQTAQDLQQKIKQKAGLPTPTTQSQPLSAINSYRRQHDLPALETHPQLDDAAYFVALDLANQTATDSPQIDIKKAAQLADYSFQHIAFLTQISPLPLIQTPEQVWQEQHSNTLLNPDFQHLGLSQLRLPSPSRLISVAVFANPQSPSPASTPQTTPTPSYYTGVELWQEIQKYRREHGVPEFKQDNTLCTLASVRINQFLELGKLDNHQGFEPLIQQYKEEDKIRFNQVAENILYGYPTPQAAVQAWDDSLGHQALMQDGSYVWGCTAANHGYAVLIAAF